MFIPIWVIHVIVTICLLVFVFRPSSNSYSSDWWVVDIMTPFKGLFAIIVYLIYWLIMK